MDLKGLASRLNALRPEQRLLIAASLIQEGKPDLAEAIAERVVEELKLGRLLDK